MFSLFLRTMALLRRFQHWFDRRFGWFFTNGMKACDPSRERPVRA